MPGPREVDDGQATMAEHSAADLIPLVEGWSARRESNVQADASWVCLGPPSGEDPLRGDHHVALRVWPTVPDLVVHLENDR
jgi:hypothetical protein